MTSSTTLEIDQFLPSFAPRDAIGYHTLKMQEVLRSLGIRSEIYSDEIKGELQGLAHPFAKFTRQRYRRRRYIMYQASTGSPIVRYLLGRHEPILINYHNITPKDILGRWDVGVAMVVGQGVKQLSVLKDRIIGAISVSEYNKWCLKQEGITEHSFVAAPYIPLPRKSGTSLEAQLDKSNQQVSKWLFVGRIAPNKAQHDIIKAFSAYRMGWDPNARLTLVGSVSSERYARSLEELIRNLGIVESVDLTGPIDDAGLERHYREATVFVCLSDHEGFGFPIIEALNHSVPVVAFASTAIPETLGTSGILLSSKEPLQVAAAVALVETDPRLRDDLRERSQRTLTRYSFDTAKQENLSALKNLIPEMAEYL